MNGIHIFLIAIFFGMGACASSGGLQQSLRKLEAQSDGRVGICALDIKSQSPVCINGDKRFPLQSVMKLVVAAAVMDAVDRKLMRMEDAVIVRAEDISPGPKDFSDLVRRKGTLETTLYDLMRRAIVESDSTSVDVLIDRLGGITAVQDFLKRNNIQDVRIDRNERHLQAESVGLTWRSEYADSDKFEMAIKALSPKKQEAAWVSYLNDPRDTATPEGMLQFLQALASGRLLSEPSTKKILRRLLSEPSTKKILSMMEATETGADRLKAGLPKGWRLGHKTGTGRAFGGMRSATNDVGILTGPSGRQIAVVVFISASKRSDADQAKLIANAAARVVDAYR